MKGYKIAVYAYSAITMVTVKEIFQVELFPVICLFSLGMSAQALFMLCDYKLTKKTNH